MNDDARTKREAFSRRMTDILNHAALNLAIAVGYRTGLFETLSRLEVPQTPLQIAEAAGCSERYVREWLAVMGTGGIVDISADANGQIRYHLPPEHAAFLTRGAGGDNLAVYTQEIPLLTTQVLEDIVAAFATGEGLPYEKYPRFQAFMSELADNKHETLLVGDFLPSIEDGALVARLQTGIRVCDLGCGQGVALVLMAEAFPASRFTGIDISGPALAEARRRAAGRKLENVDFLEADAADPGALAHLAGTFDYITAFDAIHDQRQPLAALRNVRRLLAPQGLFSMVDIDAHSSPVDNAGHPLAPFLYTVSLMHCMPVGLYRGGQGLGMMWGRETAQAMLQKAGFSRVEVLTMDFDPFNIHFLCRR